jgi:signal peptidase II
VSIAPLKHVQQIVVLYDSLLNFSNSLVDKIFWNGSLDFIQLQILFTFDTKDVYISVFIGLVLLFLVQNNQILKQIGTREVLQGFANQFKKK